MKILNLFLINLRFPYKFEFTISLQQENSFSKLSLKTHGECCTGRVQFEQ